MRDTSYIFGKMTLASDLWVMDTNWIMKAGTITDVRCEIINEYHGRSSGILYPERVLTIKILDCDYPVVWLPRCFVESKPIIDGIHD